MARRFLSRRSFLHAAFSALPAYAFGASAASESPNVLFIAVDDLNDWVGCLRGHPDAHTPNIDRLAGRGVLFTNAHCAAPLCNPSRTSVMTGVHPRTSGVLGNLQDWREEESLANVLTLPQTFRKNGYRAFGGGKIFHANQGGETGALTGGHGGRQGFHHPQSWDERFPSSHEQLPMPTVRNGQNFNGLDIWHWDWGAIDVPDETTMDGRLVHWVESVLQRTHDSPFFLGAGVYRPHGPWYVPREYFDRFDSDTIRLPLRIENDVQDIPRIATGYLRYLPGNFHRMIREHDLYESAVRAYLANISFADAMVGRILNALEASRYADNTIIVLWSDHGWHLGEKQRWHKSTLWEEATRVPLIVSAPGISQPGTRCDEPVSLVDLYPTLMDLCGFSPSHALDGESLVPQLQSPETPRTRPAITSRNGDHHAVRSRHWRYIRYSDGSEELYDHRTDPHEWTNRAMEPEQAPVLDEHRAWLNR